ncbi:alpha/beta hydrolase [Kineosporia sp. J2-2]|uniref:Alpha/beta hydrolase n=1 Tax=Kineosporia corallincola TaxID=2835133 RepID=A0ABS5TCL6_9ACTN|nr:alpha/beta hydrolase [Kineosporia corallincola]MBT0768164.1 alpha/beta hydrolase [Kineosporia corallincola]
MTPATPGVPEPEREPEPDLDLTHVPTPRPGPRPAVLVLPGGAYGHHGPHEGEPVARWLAGLGLHAFVLRYRVSPHRHPAPLDDAVRALARIRSRAGDLGVDAGRVGVLGFSAGGHLAASLANTAAPPDLSVLAYPVISFTDEPHEGSVHHLLGEPVTTRQRLEHSAELHVSATTPPAFVWHTADDPAVPVGHSLRYVAALAAAGVPAELHVFPSGRHGLGLSGEAPYVAHWTRLCERWLATFGWTEMDQAMGQEPARS